MKTFKETLKGLAIAYCVLALVMSLAIQVKLSSWKKANPEFAQEVVEMDIMVKPLSARSMLALVTPVYPVFLGWVVYRSVAGQKGKI